MANFNQKGKQAHLVIPDWVKKEQNEKRKDAMIGYLFSWAMFGDDNDGYSLDDYFDIGLDGWTKEDTDYIINQFVKHSYIKLDDKKRCLSLV